MSWAIFTPCNNWLIDIETNESHNYNTIVIETQKCIIYNSNSGGAKGLTTISMMIFVNGFCASLHVSSNGMMRTKLAEHGGGLILSYTTNFDDQKQAQHHGNHEQLVTWNTISFRLVSSLH